MRPGLLEIVCCPECKGPLELEREKGRLACSRCKLAYPVDERGVPHLIADEATPLSGGGQGGGGDKGGKRR